MNIQNDTDFVQSSPFKGDKRGSWKVADTIEYELLKENAKANRNNMTEAESAFWQLAKASRHVELLALSIAESAFWQLAKASGLGEKCRRQYIIGQYIVDFFFRKSMLIVELDGGYHFTEEQQKEDAIRQDWLVHMGYRIIRFTNEEVLFDTDNVIKRVQENLINK